VNWLNDIRDVSAAAITALLYVVPLLSIPLAIFLFAKGRRTWAWVCTGIAILSLVPFAIFLVVYYNAVTFPERRAAALAALPREAVPKDSHPRSLAIAGDAANAARLLAVGFVDAIIQYPDGLSWPRKLLLTPKHDAGCIEANVGPASFSETLSAAMLARGAFMNCTVETRLHETPTDAPPIELLRDAYATLAIPNRPGRRDANFTYRAWELRWSPERGGKLIDYDEVLYVEDPSYYISWRTGFHYGNGRPAGERRDLDSFDFVAHALGFDPVKDVPLAATSSELSLAVSTLVSRINAGKDGRGDALRLLLGQWGDNPVLREGLKALDPAKAGAFVTNSLAILAEGDLDEKRRGLYPRLHGYRDIFVKLCPEITDPAACEKIVPEIEKRAREGAFGEI